MRIEDILKSRKEFPPADPEFLKLFVMNAPGAIAMLDGQLHFIAVTERFIECYGLEGVHILDRHTEDVFPDMPVRWKKTLSRVMDGESLKCERDYFLRSNGLGYWLRWEAMPFRLVDGSIGGILIFIEMLTNEVDAENSLRFVLDAAEIGVWERDLIENKLRVSEQSEKLLGFLPGSMGNDPEKFDSCVHPDDVSIISSAAERAIADRLPAKVKFRVIWPDGSVHWLYSFCECEFSLDGMPIRLRGVSLDITETQALAIELKELTADLEKKIDERTQELRVATEAKSRFLANMSHEIRNPLNSVTILAKLLEIGDLDEDKRKEFLHRISSATNSVANILDEVLDFSKLEAGQLTLESSPFNPADILNDLRALFEQRAEDKGIQIEFSPIDCGCILDGDGSKLKQILVNLLGNAIKFTESGSVLIETHHQRTENNRLELTFDIIDTGIGIDTEVIPSLFHPFTQADNGITRKFGGTGLGLSISKNLAELMGGKIDVKSTRGLGSTFGLTVDFPILENCGGSGQIQAESKDRNCLRDFHILIVDDDEGNTDAVSELLHSYGASTTVSHDGADALEKIGIAPGMFDIVLMDIQMPIMDGIEASRRIRNDLGLHTLPIIAVTAGVLPHQLQDAIAAGITELFRKPLDNDVLISAILRFRQKPIPANPLPTDLPTSD